jgi:hypothetical protein
MPQRLRRAPKSTRLIPLRIGGLSFAAAIRRTR